MAQVKFNILENALKRKTENYWNSVATPLIFYRKDFAFWCYHSTGGCIYERNSSMACRIAHSSTYEITSTTKHTCTRQHIYICRADDTWQITEIGNFVTKNIRIWDFLNIENTSFILLGKFILNFDCFFSSFLSLSPPPFHLSLVHHTPK